MKRYHINGMRLRILLLVTVMELGNASVGHTQPQIAAVQKDLERLQLVAQRSIAGFRTQVQSSLSPGQAAIEGRIRYAVLATGAVNAQAYVNAGERRIDIGAGLLQVYEFLSVAMLMPIFDARECAIRYTDHVLRGVERNGQAQRVGAELTPVYEPFAYARRNTGICEGVSYDRLRLDPTLMRMQQAYLGASIRWLLAYELGHHIYGHRFTGSFKTSRANEKQADMFAFKVSISGEPSAIVLSAPAYLVMAGFGGAVEDESRSRHPDGARRFAVMVEALKSLPDEEPHFRRYLEREGLSRKWDQTIETAFGDIQSLLRN